MIVKNEELTLARILNQVIKFADELIIVDTGSSDNTKNIANNFTDKVYDFEWVDDFALARNFSFSKASSDYIMWLDADDYIEDTEVEKLISLKANIDCDCVMLPYCVSFDEKGKTSFWYYRERILRRCESAIWQGFIHEAIIPFGKIVNLKDIPIKHLKVKKSGNRNLQIYQSHIQKGEKLNTRHLYYYARELYYNNLLSQSLDVLEEFFTRTDGFIANIIDAYILASRISKRLGEATKSEDYLFKALKYSKPSSELCVSIGDVFFEKADYNNAIFWYELAMSVAKSPIEGAFYDVNTGKYTPALQLCVCYYRLGDLAKSIKYNNIALKAHPKSPIALSNKNFFKDKLSVKPKTK